MRIETKKQHKQRRLKNFDEVCPGYTPLEAKKEAERCLHCKDAPCIKACPLGIDIPGFIKDIKEGNSYSAVKKIKEKNPLPSVCGRICHNEKYCEAACKLSEHPVSIRLLERFASLSETPTQTTLKKPKKTSKKIAIIGSGPAGFTAAHILAHLGYAITIYDALHLPGGVMRFGIPSFRLPNDVIDKEYALLSSLGVHFIKNTMLGKAVTLPDLHESYDAVFIGIGASIPKFIGLSGENLGAVYSANEYLIRTSLMQAHQFPYHHTPIKSHKRTVVIGGGNLAIDAARTARRMGSTVTLLYRRSIEDMPAKKEEIAHAQEEGIELLMMTYAKRILGEKIVTGIECTPMMLGEMDEFGNRNHTPIEDAEFLIDCDSVILAMGQRPHQVAELRSYSNGSLMTDDKMRSSMKGVFAGGDVVPGEPSLIKAISDGRKAAQSIHEYLSGSMF